MHNSIDNNSIIGTGFSGLAAIVSYTTVSEAMQITAALTATIAAIVTIIYNIKKIKKL